MIATKPKILNSDMALLRGIAQGRNSITQSELAELASYAIQLEISKRENEHYLDPSTEKVSAMGRQMVPEGNPLLVVVEN